MAVEKALSLWIVSFALFFAVFHFRLIETNLHINHSALLLWLVFIAYWVYAARSDQDLSNSPAKQQNLKEQQSRRTRLAHLLLVVTSVPQMLLTDGVNHLTPLSWSVVQLIGYLLGIYGVVWAIWARRTLGKQWRGIVEIRKDHKLIKEGPYGITRHPIYTGIFALSFGCVFLVGGRTAAWVGCFIVFALYMFKISQEEQLLVQQFQQQYHDYKKKVPKVIPGIHFI